MLASKGSLISAAGSLPRPRAAPAGAEKVIVFGQTQAESDGAFTLYGRWACLDDDEDRQVTLRVQDFDESTGKRVTIPCSD